MSVITPLDVEAKPRTLDVIADDLRAARSELIRAKQARCDGELALHKAEESALKRHRQLEHELKLATLGLTQEQAESEWRNGNPI